MTPGSPPSTSIFFLSQDVAQRKRRDRPLVGKTAGSHRRRQSCVLSGPRIDGQRFRTLRRGNVYGADVSRTSVDLQRLEQIAINGARRLDRDDGTCLAYTV